MSTVYRTEGHAATVARQKARRAVVAGKARWIHERPKAVEVRPPSRPPVKHVRTAFGSGLLAWRPSYRLDCTVADYEWWMEEERREEDRIIDRMYAEFLAQERIENGLDAYLPPTRSHAMSRPWNRKITMDLEAARNAVNAGRASWKFARPDPETRTMTTTSAKPREPMDFHHARTDDGFRCPVTSRVARQIWTEYARPGIGNSCEHCTGEKRTIAGILHDLNEKARREAELHDRGRSFRK